MKREKRVVITAIRQLDETRTAREFFSVPLKYSEDSMRAIRTRFARKHSIELDQVIIEQAAERVRYHTPKPRSNISTDDYNSNHAIAYATWLAHRDGIALPAEYKIKARADWAGVYEGRTYRRRVQAVEWGTEHKEEVYNKRKDGRRGAYSHTITHFDVALRVEIPNWDWQPAEPQEESVFPTLYRPLPDGSFIRDVCA